MYPTKSSKILVTGGAGFIGSAFARYAVKKGYKITIVDKLTYAGDLRRLGEVRGAYKFYKTDICNQKQVELIFRKEEPDIVVNFAAESHVDRSIHSAKAFLRTNVLGVEALLSASRKHKVKKFIHISTDEVYGDIEKGEFSENYPLRPSSPYSAAKAAADLLLKSYIRTYQFPAIIVRPCNNYGPWQYPEKLIPLAILKILNNQPVPVYGKGKNIREWLYVDDCARGILDILEKCKIGEIYNLGSGQEKENLEVVKTLLRILNAVQARFKFVKDRAGHDIRYKLNCQKIRKETSWRPQVTFAQGLKNTVRWYLENKDWVFSKMDNIAKLYKE